MASKKTQTLKIPPIICLIIFRLLPDEIKVYCIFKISIIFLLFISGTFVIEKHIISERTMT